MVIAERTKRLVWSGRGGGGGGYGSQGSHSTGQITQIYEPFRTFAQQGRKRDSVFICRGWGIQRIFMDEKDNINFGIKWISWDILDIFLDKMDILG